MPTSQTTDVDADASAISAPIVDRTLGSVSAATLAPPVIAPARRRAPEPSPVVTLAAKRAARAETLAFINPALGPMLAAVPGLADTLFDGALAPSDALALPAGVAELTGSPWLVVDGRLVLASGDEVEAEWSEGTAELVRAPKSIDDPSLFVAKKAIAKDALPAAMVALVGATVKVFDRTHEVCVARVTGLEVEARVIDSGDWDDDGKQTLATHTPDEVFELGTRLLVAHVEPVSGTGGSCAEGTWAAPVEAPRPMLFRSAEPDSALGKSAVRAFRKLDSYARAQKDFATFYTDEQPESGRWDATVEHTLARWVSDDGTREVVVVHADTWDGCGSNGQTLTALFDVTRTSGKVALTPISSRAWDFLPAGLVDIERDGELEIIKPDMLVHWRDAAPPSEDNGWVDASFEALERYEIADIDEPGCGC